MIQLLVRNPNLYTAPYAFYLTYVNKRTRWLQIQDFRTIDVDSFYMSAKGKTYEASYLLPNCTIDMLPFVTAYYPEYFI